MKQFYTVLVAVVFFTKAVAAQSISETFNSGLASLTAGAWKFSNISLETSSSVLIQGQSLATKSLGTSTLATPYLDFSGTIDVSIDYRISEKLNGNATRRIEIGLVDSTGNFSSLSFVVLDKSSTPGTITPAVATLSATGLSASGTKRLAVKVDSNTGDGQTYIILDNLKLTGSFAYHYGSSFSNSAPTAVNDFFFSPWRTTVSGTVLTNDTDPNTGEAAISAVLVTAPSEPGNFVLNTNGTFSFTPDAGFAGGPVIFTYQAVDNGYDPLQSNVATVVINYAVNSPLPIHLISFSGAAVHKKAQLQWTADENETGDYFEVLKSEDGSNYNSITRLPVSSRSGLENYSFTDNLELSTTTYYKLKIVSKENRINYSNTIALKNAKVSATKLMLLGNPVAASLDFVYNASVSAPCKVSIYTMAGAKLLATQFNSQKGNNVLSLQLNQKLAAGTYLLEISNEKERSVVRFLKQ